MEIPLVGDLRDAEGLVAHVLVGGEERVIPVQILEKVDNRYGICVTDIEGLSAAPVRLSQVSPDSTISPDTNPESDPALSNEYYDLAVAPNGALSIRDKQTGTEVQALVFEDSGDKGDEYNYCPVPGDVVRATAYGNSIVAVVEDGPVFRELQIDTVLTVPEGLTGAGMNQRSDVMVDVPISTRVRLYAGIDRVDFTTTVGNAARDHRLRVHFTTPNAGDLIHAKEPYGMTSRPAVPIKGGDDWAEPPRVHTSHNQGIIKAGDLALFSRGLPEYEAIAGEDGNIQEVALTLIRGVGRLSRDDLETRPNHAGPGVATPDAQCLGKNTFEYSLNLRGQEKNSAVIQQANDYLHRPKFGPKGITRQELLRISSRGAVMSRLWPAIGGDAVMARFYNPDDTEATVSLSGIFQQAVRCDAVAGMPLDEADARKLLLRAGELVTVKMS